MGRLKRAEKERLIEISSFCRRRARAADHITVDARARQTTESLFSPFAVSDGRTE